MNDKNKTSISTFKYLLVRWLEEDAVGIMPSSAVHKEDKATVGAIVRMKWKGKTFYDAEILKMSSKYGHGHRARLTLISEDAYYVLCFLHNECVLSFCVQMRGKS